MHFYQLIALATIALALPTPDIIHEKVLNKRRPEEKAPSAIIPKDPVPLDDVLEKIITKVEAFVLPHTSW